MSIQKNSINKINHLGGIQLPSNLNNALSLNLTDEGQIQSIIQSKRTTALNSEKKAHQVVGKGIGRKGNQIIMQPTSSSIYTTTGNTP